MSKWKLIRMTEPQFEVVRKHGRSQYKSESPTEGLRAILNVYFMERGIPFPMDIGVWGDIGNVQKGKKSYVTNGKKSIKGENE